MKIKTTKLLVITAVIFAGDQGTASAQDKAAKIDELTNLCQIIYKK